MWPFKRYGLLPVEKSTDLCLNLYCQMAFPERLTLSKGYIVFSIVHTIIYQFKNAYSLYQYNTSKFT